MLVKDLIFKTQDGTNLGYHQIDEIWELRNYPIKLSWTFEGDEITIEDQGKSFFFEVCNDFIIVLYQAKHSNKYKHPKNLVIYNANGTIKHNVEAPYFKSDEMIKGIPSNKLNQSKFKTWIIPPHKKEIKNMWGKIKEIVIEQGFMDGLKKKDNKITVTISDQKYFEHQYLDVINGQFLNEGEYIGKY